MGSIPHPACYKTFFFKPLFRTFIYPCPVISFLLSSFIASLAILVGEIFSCKDTAVGQVSSTAVLIGSWIERQPSQIEDGLSVPLLLRSSGWVFRKIHGHLLAFPVLFPLSDLHVKSIPTRKSKGFQQRERKTQCLTD